MLDYARCIVCAVVQKALHFARVCGVSLTIVFLPFSNPSPFSSLLLPPIHSPSPLRFPSLSFPSFPLYPQSPFPLPLFLTPSLPPSPPPLPPSPLPHSHHVCRADHNMFCAVGKGSILFCRAMMTFEHVSPTCLLSTCANI